MRRLRVVGLSHQTAPVDLRERLAVPAGELTAVASRVRGALGDGGECVLLSTCNRVELYAASEGDADLFGALCDARGADSTAFAGHTSAHAGPAAVRHLFRVAASLDSLVPGEGQILGQVRQAHEHAARHDLAGPVLGGLFQRAVAAGREVRATTDLAAGRTSVASVAADYAGEVFDSLASKTVLCVGAGKMAGLVLDRLRRRDLGGLIVANRDAAKAARFAAKHGGEGRSLAELPELLGRADVVVTSTGSREPVITADMLSGVMKRRRYRPLLIVDIAVPRDVEPSAGELTNVYLYDVDDLQAAVARTAEGRRGAVEAAEAVVERHVAAYLAWHGGRNLGPTIRALYDASHAAAAEEVGRSLSKLPDLDDVGRRQVEELARRIVNKLLHGPVSTLRTTAADDHHGPAYRHAVRQLFSLSDDGEDGSGIEETG